MFASVDTTRLAVFRQVVSSGSFTAAAAALGISQPAVSQPVEQPSDALLGQAPTDRTVPSTVQITGCGASRCGVRRVMVSSVVGAVVLMSMTITAVAGCCQYGMPWTRLDAARIVIIGDG